MPALPPVDFPSAARRGLAGVSHALVRREVDHRVLEALAVSTFSRTPTARRRVVRILTQAPVATICISMGLLLYWGIKKEGSWTCRPKKK